MRGECDGAVPVKEMADDTIWNFVNDFLDAKRIANGRFDFKRIV